MSSMFDVGFSQEFTGSVAEIATAAFLREATAYSFLGTFSYTSSQHEVPKDIVATLRASTPWVTNIVASGTAFGINGCVWMWLRNDGELSASVATTSQAEIDLFKTKLDKLFPKEEVVENTVPFTIWAMNHTSGPQRYNRKMVVPSSLQSVAQNYSSDVAAQFGFYHDLKPPVAGGKIILWQGLPGSGKTYALRALAGEWRDWCNVHYVSDPEEFFGRSPTYMMHVLLGDSYGVPDEKNAKYSLLILEDAGELIASDARSQSGQGLSRLLNVADGILGQGLNLLILITTNEELGALNEAVQRPGRCLDVISFKPLSKTEANAWLECHGSKKRVDGSATVAELYAMLADRKTREHKAIGFKS